jgi:hypothetical protein
MHQSASSPTHTVIIHTTCAVTYWHFSHSTGCLWCLLSRPTSIWAKGSYSCRYHVRCHNTASLRRISIVSPPPMWLTMWLNGKPCSESPAEACALDTTGACCYSVWNKGRCEGDCNSKRCEDGVAWKTCIQASYESTCSGEECSTSVKFRAGATCTADLCSAGA